MLEVAVGLAAALLVLAGILVIAGPAVPRALRLAVAAVRQGAPATGKEVPPPGHVATATEPATNQTTLRALGAAARLHSLLRAAGEQDLAAQLRAASRRVRDDEAEGLVALAAVLRPLRAVDLDGDAGVRYAKLVTELRDAVKDRSEQLELLRFR